MDSPAVRAAFEAVQAELEPLYLKRKRLETERVALEGEIAAREDFLKQASTLLGEAPKKEPLKHAEDDGFTFGPDAVPNIAVLKGIPRNGYGSVTRGVEALLKSDSNGFSARALTDALQTAKFHLNGPDPEMAIRSALKNLRNQGRAIYDSDTGRYRDVRPPR